MRIVFVIPYFYPALEYGGTPRVAYEIARALVRRKHFVRVLTTDSNGRNRTGQAGHSNHSIDQVDGIEVHRYSNLSNYLAFRHRMFVPLAFFRDVRAQLSGMDVVHIHEFRSFLTVAASSAAWQARVPYILSPHGGLQHLGKGAAKTVFDMIWGKKILERAAVVCAVSPIETKDAIEFGVNESRIHRFPSAIDLGLFRDLPRRGLFLNKAGLAGRRIVLFLGRLNWIKGIDLLIKAFDQVRNLEDVHLVIAGPDDGAEGSLRSLVRELSLQDQVTFAGFMNDTEKIEALVDSGVVVIPSSREGFPLTVLEALACRAMLIVSSACQVGDWLGPDCALKTFQNGNVVALAARLKEALTLAAPERLLDQGRSLVLEQFSAEALAARAEVLYDFAVTPAKAK